MKRWTDDLGAWTSSLRFSGFTVLTVALVAAGAFIVSPSLTTFVQQRREIAELRSSVEERRKSVEQIDVERAKWKDPAYIRAQARDRLFYVMPGETQLNVIDDIVMPLETAKETYAELSEIEGDWARSLASSFVNAGTTDRPLEPAAEAGDEPAAPIDPPLTEEPAP